MLGSNRCIWDPRVRSHLSGCFQKMWEKTEESPLRSDMPEPPVEEDEVGLLPALLCLEGRQSQSSTGEEQLRGAGLKPEAVCRVRAQEGRAAFVSCVPAAVPTTYIKIELMDQRGSSLSLLGSVPAKTENTPVTFSASLPAFKTRLKPSLFQQILLSCRGVRGMVGRGGKGRLCWGCGHRSCAADEMIAGRQLPINNK